MTLHFFSDAFRVGRDAGRALAEDAAVDGVLAEVCAILRTPIAILALRQGTGARAVCATGIALAALPPSILGAAETFAMLEGVLSVPDLRADPRLRAHPLVAASPHLRHYTGTIVPGALAPLGVLCGMDVQPRGPASFRQRAQLRRLAGMVAERIGAPPHLG
ncbi:hypothetical protein [Sphingomonas azotifigens]|uniref:hypothetical protein n=1 Tax=Sphingomonas azotifigens TaxID=330920 RepID=UPI000A00A761|nr:hypothetical protein [Sphingomonas azotifigens]